jgi:hypothetical protein
LSYVHTEATAARRDELVVLAAWAFREADERALPGTEVQLDVGGTAMTGTNLGTVLELVDEMLLDGTAHTSPMLDAALRRARRARYRAEGSPS